nr:hypothetical protein [Tanacetum cinerariifolium]
MAFVSSPSPNSTTEVPADFGLSTASPQVSTPNLRDATVYAFLANQPNRSQLVHEDLEQIHEDDLEEMDLKWQLALISMRAKRFFQKTGKKITINGSDTVGYDKAKVECFNCHNIGHFTRECRVLRNQENRTRNQETTRRTINVEDTSSKAMVAIDEAGFDWSYMADDEAPTNMAFMAFSDSEYDELRVEFNKSECTLAKYKRGLGFVEEQLVHYKKNESLLNENIAVLKRDISIKDSEITVLKSKLEKISKEKDDLDIKIEKFENSSQSLDKLIGSQITDKNKRGLGYVSYNAIPPPHTKRFLPLRIDLSYTGLPEFAEPRVQSYGVKPIKVVTQTSSVKISELVKQNNGAPLIEDRESKREDEVVSPPKIERKTVEHSVDKGHSHKQREDEGYFDSGCSKHMTRNISYLTDFKEFDGGYVSFGRGAKGGKITSKRTIRTATKDETSRILKSFITEIENLGDKKVKIIRFANGTKFKNRVMNEFCEEKGKFDGKSDEGFFIGYSTTSKAVRVYNTRTMKVQTLMILQEKEQVLMQIQMVTIRIIMVQVQRVIIKRPNAENSTKDVNTVRPSINNVSSNINTASPIFNIVRQSDDFFGADNDMRSLDISNISTIYPVPTTLNTRIHKDHSLDNVLGDIQPCVQTRRMTVTTDKHRFISAIYEEKTHKDLHSCLFSCFLSQEEPKRITNALKDPAWVEAMQEELLQFQLQKGCTQEEGINYDKFYAPVARIESIRLFLAYASFMGFLVYHMDVMSAFLYVRIDEEVYVFQPSRFRDLDYPDKVYKVEKAFFDLHQAPRAWYETLDKYLLDNGFHRGKIDQTLFIKRQRGYSACTSVC